MVPTVLYTDLVNQLRTGDIFLFHGDSEISRAVEMVTGCPYSHAAMIFRPDPAAPPLIWEAGPNPIADDPSTHSKHGGAQLGDLETVMGVVSDPRYGDVPFVRRLVVDRPADFETLAAQAIADLDGTPFGTYLDMAKNWALGRLHIVTTPHKLFCAELVATTYMRMGLLPMSPPPNAYAPKSFSEQGHLPLTRGQLGPLMQVAR